MKIGWIGIGRMGLPMVSRLLNAGHPVSVWNRTRSKAEPLASLGAVVVDRSRDLASADVVFTMLATGKDLKEILFGEGGVVAGDGAIPRFIVDCSTIGADESNEIRGKLESRGVVLLSAPVSGNPRCVVAGKLSSVVSGPKAAFDEIEPLIRTYAVSGVSYVGEGELARFCKIAHNVFLGVVLQSLCEVTLLAQKAGVPRHAFLEFMNDSALGSTFTRYKSPALVNLDFTTTFTMALQCKDIDLGLAAGQKLGVAMPAAAATRQMFQSHMGAAIADPDPTEYLEKDFSAVIETIALLSGVKLVSEGVPVLSGLEV